MITITAYQERWPAEFQKLGLAIRQELGELALRIDHIGSTSIPGLAAKDIIDIQVTAAELTPDLEQALQRCGYQRVQRIIGDHLPPGETDPARWIKWIFKPASDTRPVHLHVRLANYPNQRYPLLFRDYLRAHPASARAYFQVKTALADHYPFDDNLEVYYAVKDPVCDLIIQGLRVDAQIKFIANGVVKVAGMCFPIG